VYVFLVVNVYRANCHTAKVALIEAARENTEVIRLMLRLLHDLKQISLKEFVSCNAMLESVSKQLSAWHRSRINKSDSFLACRREPEQQQWSVEQPGC